MRTLRNRGLRAVGTAALALVLAGATLGVLPVAASSCGPPYSVGFSAPIWSVTWRGGAWAQISDMWYIDPWNASVQRVGPHVGPNATAAEPVTFQDRDRDGNLSGSDVFQIWDENSSLRTFSIRWGPNETSAYASVGFTLADGYETQCIAPPFWADGTVLVFGIVVLVSVIVLAVLVVRHASKR